MQILGQYRSRQHRPVRLAKLCMKTLVSPGVCAFIPGTWELEAYIEYAYMEFPT